MLVFVIIVCLIVSILLNVLTSCYVCYNVAVDEDSPRTTLISVAGIVLINVMIPYFLGCATGLWYIG